MYFTKENVYPTNECTRLAHMSLFYCTDRELPFPVRCVVCAVIQTPCNRQ